MLSLLLLGMALPFIRAQQLVSGISRVRLNNPSVQFSLDAYSETVVSIDASVKSGPNRTASNSLPVPKLYGVNVSFICIAIYQHDSTLTTSRLVTGLSWNHGIHLKPLPKKHEINFQLG